MITKNLANNLLKAVVGAGKWSSEALYIGLFTSMPSSTGTGGEEVDAQVMKGYERKQLNYKNTDEDTKDTIPWLSEYFTEDVAWDTSENAYKLQNTKSIQMNAISESVTSEVSVVGFGIWPSATSTDDLLAFGELKESVTLQKGSVPIFYYNDTLASNKGEFTLLLSDGTTSA